MPRVSVPVLSKAMSVTSRRRLQRLALAEQNAELGRASRAGHDGRGRREAHGAGAGDDEHGDRVDQRVGETRLRTDQHPDDEGERGDGEDGRDEDGGDAVDQRLDRQLRALRLLDHADDAGERRVGADARGAEGEGAGRR